MCVRYYKLQEKPRETISETSKRVGPERVNKWPNCVLDEDDDDDKGINDGGVLYCVTIFFFFCHVYHVPL